MITPGSCASAVRTSTICSSASVGSDTTLTALGVDRSSCGVRVADTV